MKTEVIPMQLNVNHGHETEEHRVLKQAACEVLRHYGYGAIFCEHHNCDLVAVRPRSAAILGVEIERSTRNVMQNLARNFAQGCKHVLIISPDFKIVGEIARKLASELPQEFQDKVGVTTLATLQMVNPQL
jgi:predicted NAD/FAD-binding protein